MNQWISVKDSLPEIPKGEKCSADVLAGMWIEDTWLRRDHPERRRFVMGVCRMITEKPSKWYPEGKSWQTFGPSHNDITHWMPTPIPPQDNKIEDVVETVATSLVPSIDGRPAQPDELHSYWCEKCQNWTLFQFEDWNMCDDCAIGEAFSDENLADCYDDTFSKEELELLKCPIKNSQNWRRTLPITEM